MCVCVFFLCCGNAPFQIDWMNFRRFCSAHQKYPLTHTHAKHLWKSFSVFFLSPSLFELCVCVPSIVHCMAFYESPSQTTQRRCGGVLSAFLWRIIAADRLLFWTGQYLRTCQYESHHENVYWNIICLNRIWASAWCPNRSNFYRHRYRVPRTHPPSAIRSSDTHSSRPSVRRSPQFTCGKISHS